MKTIVFYAGKGSVTMVLREAYSFDYSTLIAPNAENVNITCAKYLSCRRATFNIEYATQIVIDCS